MARRVIALLGQPIVTEDDKAAEAIKPGHLLGYDGSGNLVKHASAGVACAKAFALERDELGRGIDDTYASVGNPSAYAIGDYVKKGAFHGGCHVYAWVASGYNQAKGVGLESDGGGRLRVLASGVCLGMALEALDNSAGPGDARLRVEIT